MVRPRRLPMRENMQRPDGVGGSLHRQASAPRAIESQRVGYVNPDEPLRQILSVQRLPREQFRDFCQAIWKPQARGRLRMTLASKETARGQGGPAQVNDQPGDSIALAAFVARLAGLHALAAWIDARRSK